MLSGASDDEDAIHGLNAGANDYVCKPFRSNELLARLQAQLRAFDSSQSAVFTIGPYTFRPAAKLLLRIDTSQRIRLTAKEVSILKYLCRAGDRVTSREELLTEVWGYHASVSTHTLETHIYRLRQKIEVDPTDVHLLVSGPGGYRLNAGATLTPGSTANSV
jgi:DNA-binding response OmpR family regulator